MKGINKWKECVSFDYIKLVACGGSYIYVIRYYIQPFTALIMTHMCIVILAYFKTVFCNSHQVENDVSGRTSQELRIF